MRRLHRTLLSAVAVMLLACWSAGCGTTSEPLPGLELNPYTVTFATEPSEPAAGKPVVLKVGVSGKDPLSKRSEISFEIKRIGTEDRKELTAEKKDEGQYEAGYTFKETGKYSVTIHVITRSVHQVVNKEVDVK
ncbi:FixH family protein [Gorillibacterium sp. sgz5001074]|uniref:FixH family protein n=1 Tax=Gorillibacterium sp. sgz5001074 TaxID=3446695 RepID=UPI003F660CC6